MGLFDRFRETIFVKSDSELEKKIEVLKKLKEKYPNNKDIEHDLYIAELGLAGEKEIAYELKNANIGMFVLHDVNIEIQDYKAQIDYVVITPGYTYFIECKNLIGNIKVNENGDFIREYEYKGQKVRKGIYSPIRQVERQKEVYKKIWAENRGKIVASVLENGFDNYLKTLVVMAKQENILNTKYAPKDIKNKVIRSDSLIRYIKADLEKIDILASKKDMEKTAEWYMHINVPVNKNYEEDYKLEEGEVGLKEKLIAFRTATAKEKKIPPYYVFNNDELKNILASNPKSLDDLRKILPDVKVNVHGKKILEIINM